MSVAARRCGLLLGNAYSGAVVMNSVSGVFKSDQDQVSAESVDAGLPELTTCSER
jgi:hypothetical protein